MLSLNRRGIPEVDNVSYRITNYLL
ncbi:unnamed protein product [Acanthoscelides obtectus]|uniref:Uncharacterized protein n=1 Tax=Acanthoscelides obtectus TaxID=200917 RepID=A0A9P0LP80_ACAOB|nr:unnamed protein product [Acanthoscelides obtectus]CAK1658839.1 hypothetical protein AOBTE_LOCUS21154 [Acanthoscelides obtectus]